MVAARLESGHQRRALTGLSGARAERPLGRSIFWSAAESRIWPRRCTTLPISCRNFAATNTAKMIFDNRAPVEGANEGRRRRFRFSPRDAKAWSYTMKSDSAGLDGRSGKFSAVPPPHELTSRPSTVHPNWWMDDPDPAAAEGVHPGARSVNQWRMDFPRDFAQRLRRTLPPAKAGNEP
jgi:hypothetical protein